MALESICKGALSAKIDSMGAQLTSLAFDGGEYLWQGDPAYWPRHAPVLFPIVGALRGDRASSAAGLCAMKRHGIARTLEHRVVENTGEAVTFELVSTPETKRAYPYDFKLNMTYALTGPATLTQIFRVTNTGDAPLPFSVGGHPAFNVPAPYAPGEKFGDYELRFERPWTAESPMIADGGLLDYSQRVVLLEGSDVLPISHKLFEHDAVVLRDVPGQTCELVGPAGRGVRIDFGGFDYLGVWSAAGSAPFVALEPWTGTATRTDEGDSLEGKQDITVLGPGAVDERTFSITVLHG